MKPNHNVEMILAMAPVSNAPADESYAFRLYSKEGRKLLVSTYLSDSEVVSLMKGGEVTVRMTAYGVLREEYGEDM